MLSTAEQWGDALQRFKSSGLGVRAFCASEGLSVSCFYRWKSAAAGGAAGAALGLPSACAPRALPVNDSFSKHFNDFRDGFVNLGALRAPDPASAPPALLPLSLRIELGGGLVLRLERT